MAADYEDSLEFKNLLKKYQQSKSQGKHLYFDSDDFVDIAEYFLQNDDVNQALEVAEEGLRLHQNEESLLSVKVNSLISLSQFDEAEIILESLHSETDHDVYYFHAQILCGKYQEYERAKQLFDQWLDIELDECSGGEGEHEDIERKREAFLHVVLSMIDMIDSNHAGLYIQPVVERYMKDCAPLDGNDLDVDIAHACHESGLIQLEIKLYTQFLDNNPYMPQGWAYLGALQSIEGRPEEAVDSAEFALAINPSDPQGLIIKAHSYHSMGNYTEAIKAIRKYIELTGDQYFNVLLANSLMRVGEKEEASRLLKDASQLVTKRIKEKEVRSEYRMYIADAYMAGGYYKEALHHIRLALRYNPDDVDMLLQEALCLVKTKSVKDAISLYDHLVENSEGKEQFRLSMAAATDLLANNYVYASNYFFSKAAKIKEHPDHVKTYIYLAHCCFFMKMPENFFFFLKLACKYTPDLVRTFYANQLIGVDPDNYYDALKEIYKDFR